MITFIPAWGKQVSQGMTTDDFIGPIKSFMGSAVDYQVVVSDYMPELRYFLHRHDVLESQTYSLFDALQGSLNEEQKGLSLSDLNFPETTFFSYTPFNLLAYEKEALIGRVIMGDGSQILEVHYLSDGLLKTIECYDDRGFLSSRRHFEHQQLLYTEYLDCQGEWVLRELGRDGSCEVNPTSQTGLQYEKYTSLEAVKFELLEQHLKNRSTEDAIVLGVTDENASFVSQSPMLSQMTLSFFKSRAQQLLMNDEVLLPLIKTAHSCILDNESQMDRLTSLGLAPTKVHHVSPYDTRFELSRSQEIKDEILYLDVRKNDDETSQTLLLTLIQYLTEVYSKAEQQRSFKVIVRVASVGQKDWLNATVHQFLKAHYPEALNFAQAHPKSKEKTKKENSIDDALAELVYPELPLVYALQEAFEIKMITEETELFEVLSTTRLIIDWGEEADLFTQIAGISAGLPQINRQTSAYVSHQSNGWILKELQELNVALHYYLEGLKHWQEARAAAVQQIKKYSGLALRQRLCDILGEKENG